MTPESLRAHREALGLSPAQLGQALGVPQSTVWRWESGSRRVPPYLPLALAALRAGLRPLS